MEIETSDADEAVLTRTGKKCTPDGIFLAV
jgi:hypothetical protein